MYLILPIQKKAPTAVKLPSQSVDGPRGWEGLFVMARAHVRLIPSSRHCGYTVLAIGPYQHTERVTNMSLSAD